MYKMNASYKISFSIQEFEKTKKSISKQTKVGLIKKITASEENRNYT